MPRRPRIHLPGQPLHIVQRGHNREGCFFCEEDYHSYLHWGFLGGHRPKNGLYQRFQSIDISGNLSCQQTPRSIRATIV